MRYVFSVGGGPDTLATLRDALLSGTFVMLVEGSGGVTDILAFAFHLTRTAPAALPSALTNKRLTLFEEFTYKCATTF